MKKPFLLPTHDTIIDLDSAMMISRNGIEIACLSDRGEGLSWSYPTEEAAAAEFARIRAALLGDEQPKA